MAEKIMRKHMEERFGKVFNYSMTPPVPGSLNIELNNTCNQACVFCPFHGKYAINHPKPSKLDIEFVKKILQQAANLGIGHKEVGFYLAGEAFLYKELPEVICFAKQLGFKYTFITSNGVFATPERMKSVIDAGLDSIRFSINANNRSSYKKIHQTDDYDLVIENLKFLKKYKEENSLNLATSISCVITKENYEIRKEMKSFFETLVDDVVLLPVLITRLKEQDLLKKEMAVLDNTGSKDSNYICPMLFDTMYINSDGMVVPCCNAYDTNLTFFDLNKDLDLEKAWNCNLYNRYRSIFVEKASDDGTICKNCELRNNGLNSIFMD
ncbi:MAG: radical SAM protein [Spirochaetales bacterium]|nr:radical SAM protein [Spirochaetales bacterium]